ncbi:MAG TPA: acetate/propionate family kinase [Nocardioides sp.]|nr:acetate/propionate family kinase [Nocardioides sp.]
MRVLVVNAGSSSLKLAIIDHPADGDAAGGDGEVLGAMTIQRWEGADHLEPLREFLDQAPAVDAVGHRVVHGGPRYRASVRVDDEVVAYLDSIADLAPLHNPRAVAAIRAVGDLLPDLPTVAAFDTSFHATIPDDAATYALPREWNHRYQLRRYGFHGLSHAYAARRAAEITGRRLTDHRVVSCHLGAGASLCAVRDGRSVDTTMGFTPLAGLVMQTRVGSVDPGLLLWLLQQGHVDPATLSQILEHQSGLKGLSGTSGDLRDVLAARDAGDADATLALDVFVHRLVRETGAMAASAGGLDVLVFTGGMGEHAPELRAAAARGLFHLGVELDAVANLATADADISADGARVRTVVVTAREDVEVAREVRRALDGARG